MEDGFKEFDPSQYKGEEIDKLLNATEHKYRMIGRNVPDIDHSKETDPDEILVATKLMKSLNVVHAKIGHQRVNITIDIVDGSIRQVEFHGEDVDGKERKSGTDRSSEGDSGSPA